MRCAAHIVLVLLVTGCNLPPLPLFGPFNDADVGAPDENVTGPVVCDAMSRRCVANSVRVCSPDGTDFTVEPCGVGETCSAAACTAIANTCETEQPFALSATELAFDVSRDLKSQTKQLQLRNCSTTPIIVRDLVVRSPERPDRTPVFELASGDLAQSSIAAGDALDIRITYRPTAGLSHVTGRLELGLVLGELTNVEVALRSKALCVTATPYLDVGLRHVGSTVLAEGLIQNCGTEPMTVVGWEGPANLDVHMEDLPHLLEAGRELDFVVEANPEAPAFLDANLKIALSDPLLEPTIKLRGLGALPDCVDLELAEPQVLSNNQVRPPEPGDLVRIRFPEADLTTFHWLEPMGQPQGSFERLDRVVDGWTTRPRVVGRYRATLRGFDIGSTQPGCGLGNVTFDVRPADGLHVELVWLSAGDGVPEDLGFGHSMNLDLHVVSTLDGEQGLWNHVESDCFPGVIGPCGAGQGTISISQAGLPEFVRFNNPDGLDFHVGVYLSNPFNFKSVLARVRVYRDQTLIAELNTDTLQNANDFWLVGNWNEATSAWTEIDTVFSGFPR